MDGRHAAPPQTCSTIYLYCIFVSTCFRPVHTNVVRNVAGFLLNAFHELGKPDREARVNELKQERMEEW